jgi:putative peptide zinc metalloprotease protein
VGTLLFNGNPLLRYDGYYILSDLVEVPNLAQQSRDLADRLLSRFFLGPGPAGDRALPRRRRGLLLFYGLASMAYRAALVAAILWFCHKALAAYRLETVAALLVAVVVTGMLLSPAVRVWRAASAAARRDGFRWRRPLLRFLAALLVVVGLGLVPLPYSVRAPLSLELEDGRPVYVAVGGRLVECRRAGQTIHKGDVVARLENAALRREIAQLQSTRDRLVRELSGLVGRRNEDPAAAAQIPAAGEALADVEGRLRQRLGDENDLVLRTPVDGRVVPPAEKPRLPYGAAGIASWSGSPLSPRNAGCYLPTGELVCYVGPADRFEAVLAIDQSSLPLVRPGDAARIRLDCVGGEVFEGVVREIGKQQMRLAPREIATGGRLAVKPTASGGLAPTETSYYARVTVASRDPRLLVGARGQAKIRVGPQSLLGRLGRYLARTLRIEL